MQHCAYSARQNALSGNAIFQASEIQWTDSGFSVETVKVLLEYEVLGLAL